MVEKWQAFYLKIEKKLTRIFSSYFWLLVHRNLNGLSFRYMVPKVFSKKVISKIIENEQCAIFQLGEELKMLQLPSLLFFFLPPLLTRDEFNKGDYVGG